MMLLMICLMLRYDEAFADAATFSDILSQYFAITILSHYTLAGIAGLPYRFTTSGGLA